LTNTTDRNLDWSSHPDIGNGPSAALQNLWKGIDLGEFGPLFRTASTTVAMEES